MRHRRVRLMAILSSLLAMSMVSTGAPGVFAYTVGDGGNDPVHEYTVERAMALYQATQTNSEMSDYLGTIQDGTEHEDLHDHVTDRTGIFNLFLTLTHFWDGDKGPGDPVDMVVVGENAINAWQKAEVLWGMALGEYASGDKTAAYEYLGHVAHLLADQSVPAHAHEDVHASDYYEDWMTLSNAQLTEGEIDLLLLEGPVEIPEDTPFGPLYYLFYTMNQIGDFYPSDDYAGDSDWNAAYGDWIGNVYAELSLPTVSKDDIDKVSSLQTIRFHSYRYAIRATAALFDLFWKEASSHSALTVVIDRIKALDDHEEGSIGDYADFFMRIWINDVQYWNEGDQVLDTDDISPGWGFARNVGITGTIPIVIQVFDEDEEGTAAGDDDKSDIDPAEGARDMDLWVDLATGAISGDLVGTCGTTLTSLGQDDDASQIWFRILLPNVPPTAEAGPDQTVDEGDLVTLNGSFTDPNTEDTHTFLWHLESSTNGQTVPDSTSESLSFTPNDNGEYTFSFTVTDNYGASGSDTVVVMAENVAPVASIDSITDETGAEIGVDVPVALVGLEVDLSGSFTDVGTADTHTAALHWGDGSIDPETAFGHFADCTGGITGHLEHTHIYGVPGSYTIMLYVIDDDGGVSTQTAQIEVVDAAGAITAVVESLSPLADEPNIQAAIDKLQGKQEGKASNGALDKLEQDNPNAALEKIKQALEYLEEAEAASPSLDLTYDKGLLALAGKSVAVGAIADAAAVAYKQGDLLKIQDATDLVAEGDMQLAALDYVGAVDKYQEAVRKVQGIL